MRIAWTFTTESNSWRNPWKRFSPSVERYYSGNSKNKKRWVSFLFCYFSIEDSYSRLKDEKNEALGKYKSKKKSFLILSENTSLVVKKWVFATNTDFLIFTSLQPDVVIWTNRILGLTYLKPMALGCKDIGIRKSEFVAFWKRKEIK